MVPLAPLSSYSMKDTLLLCLTKVWTIDNTLSADSFSLLVVDGSGDADQKGCNSSRFLTMAESVYNHPPWLTRVLIWPDFDQTMCGGHCPWYVDAAHIFSWGTTTCYNPSQSCCQSWLLELDKLGISKIWLLIFGCSMGNPWDNYLWLKQFIPGSSTGTFIMGTVQLFHCKKGTTNETQVQPVFMLRSFK